MKNGPENYVFRRASIDDASVVANLYYQMGERAAGNHLPESIKLSPEVLSWWQQRIGADESWSSLAVTMPNQQVVGAVMYFPGPDKDGKNAPELNNRIRILAYLPQYDESALPTNLVDEAITIAKKLRLATLEAWVLNDMPLERDLLLSVGFKKTGRVVRVAGDPKYQYELAL